MTRRFPLGSTTMTTEASTPWSRQQFEEQLRAKSGKYHIHHTYHVLMHEGRLNQRQIQGWIANRFYYQIMIPVKDAALMANCREREVRRNWIQRIIDHDGREGNEGGIEAWLRLGEACGMTREEIRSLKHVLPGVRFAVDAYVNFVRTAPWQEAVCSSLTELFAPTIHRARLENWPRHYPWVKSEGLEYFRSRIRQARRDVEYGLGITLDHFQTREQQERALDILQFKLDVLWSMLDAMYLAYVVDMPPYSTAIEDSAK
jgi:pyrroloquinoline-quinone synthase